MQKKKVIKKANKKNVVRAIPKLESSSGYSWIWYLIGALIIIAALYFIYSSMTGNVITGNAVDTRNSFKPIVDMISGLIASVYDALRGPLEMVVGETASATATNDLGANIFLAKVLLMILILALVSAILSKTGIDFLKEGWTHWVVSIVVSVLSIRFLNADLIQTILMPYSTLGVTLSVAIPFVLFFLFVEKGMAAPATPSIVRKAAWVLFGVVFFAIWVTRIDDFSDQAGIIVNIYPITVVISLIMAFADGTIQGVFNKWGVAKIKASVASKNRVHLNDMLNKCSDEWTAAVARGSPDTYLARVAGNVGVDKGLKAYEKDLEELTRQINALT